MKTSEKIENLTKTFNETDDLGEVVKAFKRGVKTGLYLARDIVIAEEKKTEGNDE